MKRVRNDARQLPWLEKTLICSNECGRLRMLMLLITKIWLNKQLEGAQRCGCGEMTISLGYVSLP
jgi:hypothetical protein